MNVPDIEGSSIQGRVPSCYCPNKTSGNYTRTPKVINFSGVMIQGVQHDRK